MPITFVASTATVPAATVISTDEISSVAGSSRHVQRIKLMSGVVGSTAAISTASPLPVLIQASTATVTVQGNTSASISTASKVQVEPGAGAVFNVSESSVFIKGNSTAIISTASKVQVEPGVGAVFPISGNSTAIISTASKILAELSGGQSSVSVVPLTTVSKIQVEPGAGAVFGISGNSTAHLSTGGALADPFHTADFNSSAGTIQNRVAVGLIAPTADGAFVLGSSRGIPVTQDGSTAWAVSISGNSTAIISTASKVQVEPGVGAVFNVSESSVFIKGNSTAILSTASKVQVEPGVGAVWGISTGPVNVSESSVFIKGNSTAIISTASKIVAELSTTGMGGTTATPLYMTRALEIDNSTFANVSFDSTVAVTIWSSAASTRFNITSMMWANPGLPTQLTLHDGTTAGAALFIMRVTSTAAMISMFFPSPIRNTAGNPITGALLNASTMTLFVGGYRSA